ncbi:MAG: dipeptidase D [Flavobacteriales bacterium]|jgi:dipeptidase D
MEVRDLEPKALWNNFEDLNAVPRPSKKEERIIAFTKAFGENLGLETYVDPCGNVIIKKPATAGMEDRQTVILQSHLDMVHQKNSDTVFDFDSEGIKSYIDGEWVKAKGTTLGADNGMGAATALTLLASTDIAHPAFEALFTIDEETGMTGAFELEQGILDGTILLNLDTEDDDEFSIGCAGGIDVNTTYKYKEELSSSNDKGYSITVKGLKGGHSGMDINLERGNANKIMNRLIHNASAYGLQIAEINGGSLRNAIPRESFATIIINDDAYLQEFKKRVTEIKEEFSISDSGVEMVITDCDTPTKVMSVMDTKKVTNAIYAVHNGVYRMSSAIKGLVETSASMARVIVKNGIFETQHLLRSSVETSKFDIANSVGSVFELAGSDVEYSGSYPGWSPNPSSDILVVMEKLYKEMFQEDPQIKACHAGLECGILNERYPGLDMISFGPTIRNPHSPDEKVNIASVQKFWRFFKAVIKAIPAK